MDPPMKRIALFVLTNVAVLVVLSFAMRLLGIDRWLAAQGSSAGGMLVFAAIFGFGGAFVSLLLSKWSAKQATGAHVIVEPRTADEAWLLETVRAQARAAGIGMPDVAVYDAGEPNAFATGANRDRAMVAVSTGLLASMTRDEVEAVLGHEIAHVANGDMVTLALVQGVLNTFVLFIARLVGHAVDRAVFRSEQSHGPGFFLVYMVAQVVLGVLASLVVFWFSRQREFRADAGSALLSGRPKMIAALRRLQSFQDGAQGALPERLATFGIRGRRATGLSRLFMTHPPLEERIAVLARDSMNTPPLP